MRQTAALLAAFAVLAPARAWGGKPQPPPMKKIKVDEHIGDKVPLDLEFHEIGGEDVRLGDYFNDDEPVLLVLAYVRCKMLCSLVLHGVAEAVKELSLEPGTDYRVVTVSIDPRETPKEAAEKRRELLETAGYPEEPERWPYLQGEEKTTRRLADSLGFGYAWDPRTEQYAHPAVIFAISPDGTISRYLYGIEYPAREVRTALEAAGRGETVTTKVAQSVLSCFRFDSSLGKYRSKIRSYFRLGAVIVFSVLLSLIGLLFVWERRREKRRGS